MPARSLLAPCSLALFLPACGAPSAPLASPVPSPPASAARAAPPPVAPHPAPSSPASSLPDAAAPSAPPLVLASTPLPAVVRGRLVFAADDADGTAHLFLTTLGEHGASAAARLTSAPNVRDAAPRWSPDGTKVVFVRIPNAKAEDRYFASTVWIVDADGSNERQLATCRSICDSAAVGADGAVYYVDRTVPKEGMILRVPAAGGTPAPLPWPENTNQWSACFMSLSMAKDGRTMLVAVNNSLGWPSCMDSHLTGFYVPAIGAPSPGRRIVPHPAHIERDDAWFSNAWLSARGDRIEYDVATDTGRGTFSCALDGSDPKPAAARADWTLATNDAGDAIVALPKAGAADAPIPVVAPVPTGDAYGGAPFDLR